MTQPDLLTVLDADRLTEHVHWLAPTMGLACGQDLLATYRARRVTGRDAVTLTRREATCPGCRRIIDEDAA